MVPAGEATHCVMRGRNTRLGTGVRESGDGATACLLQHRNVMAIASASEVRPVVLIAAGEEPALAGVLGGGSYAAVQVHTGALAIEWVRDLHPDAIILDADLPDMPGIDACRRLRGDLGVGHQVPILVLTRQQPTAEQRVAGLRAGVWDFLPCPMPPSELARRLETYVQAKRNIDVALAGGLVDPTTGVHSRAALARRARELGSLMSRAHGALACLVFVLELDPPDPKVGSMIARTTRVSDVVGSMSPTEFVVLAPATEHAGAVQLARRVGAGLCDAVGGGGVLVAGSTLRAGYDAAANLTYSPIDPVELLTRAAAAARGGNPEPGHPWLRRFAEQAPRISPSGLTLDKRSTPA